FSTMHDNDPTILEREKHRNLSRQPFQTSAPMDHAPGWNEHLATTAEANVKADQSTVRPEDLAELTVKYMTEKSSPDERYEASTATYEREELAGPLKDATGNATGKIHTTVEETVETVKQEVSCIEASAVHCTDMSFSE
ncbi:hypothetical protein K488DRAFT_45946, partial [Vararia minispora EC-137]